MGIVQLPTVLPAQVGILPQMKRMVTTDSLATITTAGYLNQFNLEGNPIGQADVLDVLYSYSLQTNSGTFGMFTVSISNGVITLVQWANPGDVLLPVTSGDFANFNGTTGQIKDSGYLPSNAAKTRVVMLNAAPTSGHVAAFTDVNGTIGDAGFAASAVLLNTASTQNIAGQFTTNGNPVANTAVITATAAALATAGKVNVYVAPSVTAQIAIVDVKVFKSTGLSGGGGNRLLSLADGTLVFNDTGITAALLGTPVFTLWGGTGNTLPSAAEATISTAGANVYLQYIGGTTDFAAGSVIIAVTYAQVTA